MKEAEALEAGGLLFASDEQGHRELGRLPKPR